MNRNSAQDWLPTAKISNLRERSILISQIRSYFADHGVLEVETPVLSAATVTDPHLEAFQIQGKYLQTSPEYAMKRLLAAGSGDIYQLAKAFRQDEVGKFHNPEFTILEWYRIGFSPEDMYQEIEALLKLTLGVDDIDKVRYADLFEEFLGLDIHHCTDSELSQRVSNHCHGLQLSDRDDCLTTLFASCIEPKIAQTNPCIVTLFPASQASLARLEPDDPRFARRFEVYFKGVELANGFHELSDIEEQAERFHRDNLKRRSANKTEKPIDNRLLDALKSGLPDCVGVALGIDRLVMLKLGSESLSEVLTFNYHNA